MTRLWPLVALLACSHSTPPVTTAPTAPAAQPESPPPVETQPAPQPSETAPPTEIAAKESETEVDPKLRDWDKANLDRLLAYWTELACFREAVRTEGKLAFGTEPGSPAEERFFQFKRRYVEETNAWQQNLFTSEQRILEKSHMIGRLLEAHELVAFAYPRLFSAGDQSEVDEAEAHWVVVETKTKTYVESLGATWVAPVCSGPKKKAKGKR